MKIFFIPLVVVLQVLLVDPGNANLFGWYNSDSDSDSDDGDTDESGCAIPCIQNANVQCSPSDARSGSRCEFSCVDGYDMEGSPNATCLDTGEFNTPLPVCTRSPAISSSLHIRLRNGPTSHEGRVEVLYNEIWGTVCNDKFEDDDLGAEVVCRMLDIPGPAMVMPNSAYGSNFEGPIWLDDVTCQGDESSITMCENGANFGDEACGHHEDIGVRCGIGCPAPFRFENNVTICAFFGGAAKHADAVAHCLALTGELLDPTPDLYDWLDSVFDNPDISTSSRRMWIPDAAPVAGECNIYGIGGTLTRVNCLSRLYYMCVKLV